MRVNVTVRVTENYETLATGDMEIKATPEGLASIDWQKLCAGLIEGVLVEATTKQLQNEEAAEMTKQLQEAKNDE